MLARVNNRTEVESNHLRCEKMKLRVGFLGDVFSVYERSGIYRYAEGILEGLLQSETELILFLSSAKMTKFRMKNIVIADQFNVGKIQDKSNFLPNLAFFARNLKLSSDLNKMVDVVYSPQCRIPDVSYIFNLRIPMITTLHDLHALITKVSLLYKMRYVFRYMSPRILTKSRKIFLAVPTNFVKNQVVRLLGIPSEKVIRIPAAVSPPSWITDIHRKEINKESTLMSNKYGIEEYIMFLARQSNVPTALSLIKLLKTDYNLKTTLIIAGLGIDKAVTENLARNLNLKLKKDVLILGAISEQMKWVLLKEARLFLCLETSTSGFGIPGLEAMSVGTPVVASDTGPTREVLGDGALLAKPNMQYMAKALYDCFTDRKLSERLSHKGLERAKDFHPARIAGHLLKIMSEITSL